MALAEANVRVTLEVARFEKELRQRTQQAAQQMARDFDREANKGFAQSGRNASRSFRDSARDGMGRAGRDVATAFDNNFQQGISQTGGRAAQRLSQGMRVQLRRAGLDIGRDMANNLGAVLSGSGGNIGRQFLASLSQGITSGAVRVGTNAGNALSRSAGTGATAAGRNAGKQFNLSFGIGTAAFGRPLIAAFAVLGGQIATQVGPALGILAGLPPLILATVAAAGIAVTAFQGFGTAIKAIGKGDLEKINAAMQDLSPAARSVVREFVAIQPALSGLRREVQDAFFAQLAGQFTEVGRALTGPLRAGIIDTASQLGLLARAFTGVFTSTNGVRNLDSVFRGTGDFIGQLKPGIRDITRGFLEFAAAAAPGLNTIGQSFSTLLTRMGTFLSRSADSGKALVWVEQGVQGLKDLTKTLGDVTKIFLTLASAARPIAFALGGVFSLVSDLARVFNSLPGPIQTAVLAMVLLRNTRLPQFFQDVTRSATGQSGIIRAIGQAYRDTSVIASDYVRQQGALVANSALLSGAGTRTVSAINGTATAFSKVAGFAAGAGSAIATGFGGAVRGIIGVLGGPWGIALAAAGALLAVFSANSQAAAQRLAEYNARVREIQGTLNKTTGAITSASVEFAASNDNVRKAADAFKQYGISSDQVVQGAVRQGDAHDKVEQALRRQVTGILDNIRATGDLEAVTNATGLSQEQLTTALLGGGKELAELTSRMNILNNTEGGTGAAIGGVIGRLLDQSSALRDARGGWIEFFNQTQKATEEQRLIAASIPPATREAQKMADAMNVLADNTADASQKAQAFNEVMNQLAGGTIDVQAAQAAWNTVLQRVAETTANAVDKQKGFGAALIASNGQINTASVNGNQLFQTYSSLSKGLADSNAALIDNAQKTGDVSGALKQVGANVAAARAAFIAQANSVGIVGQAAEDLANKYGLIPQKVLTEVAIPTYANTKTQLDDINNRIRDLPLEKPVIVTALTDEAQTRLRDIGFSVTHLKDGTFEVIAKTQEAKNDLGALLAQWSNRVVNWVVKIFGGNALGNILPNKRGNVIRYAQGGHFDRLTPMSANRAEMVKPNTWRVVGDRAAGDEAFIPVNGSARSRALLAETARRMGFKLLADGDVLGTVTSAGSTVNIAPGGIVVQSPFSDPQLVARQTVNEIARAAAT